jgi:hypothetical protein
VSDLNARDTAQAIVDTISRVADRQINRAMPRTRYGVVFEVDAQARKASVNLMGQNEPSAGFVYGAVAPRVGDLVRIVIDPKGDRYIDDVLGRDFALPVVITLPEATSALRGVMVLLEGGEGVADVVYVCRKGDDDEYEWATL